MERAAIGAKLEDLLSRQNRHRLPEELPRAYKILNMQENRKYVKHETYLELIT